MQMGGRDRKTNPADNWRSLPCFCAWMAIFTLLSSACWLFYQTKRVLYAMKRLAEVHMVLWNGLSFLLSLISPLSTSSLFVCLSLSLSRSLSVRVSYWLSQIPLVRRVLFGLTWDKNRPTRQLYVIPVAALWNETVMYKYCLDQGQ